MSDPIADWLAAGHKVTRCPTVHLVASQHPDEYPKEPVPEKPARRPRGGGGWTRYWAKRRAMVEAKS